MLPCRYVGNIIVIDFLVFCEFVFINTFFAKLLNLSSTRCATSFNKIKCPVLLLYFSFSFCYSLFALKKSYFINVSIFASLLKETWIIQRYGHVIRTEPVKLCLCGYNLGGLVSEHEKDKLANGYQFVHELCGYICGGTGCWAGLRHDNLRMIRLRTTRIVITVKERVSEHEDDKSGWIPVCTRCNYYTHQFC